MFDNIRSILKQSIQQPAARSLAQEIQQRQAAREQEREQSRRNQVNEILENEVKFSGAGQNSGFPYRNLDGEVKRMFSMEDASRFYNNKLDAGGSFNPNLKPGKDVDLRNLIDLRARRFLSPARKKGHVTSIPSSEEFEAAFNANLEPLEMWGEEPRERAILDWDDYNFVDKTKDEFYEDLGKVLLKSETLDTTPLREKYGSKSDFYDRLIYRLEEKNLKEIRDSITPETDRWYETLDNLYKEYERTVPGYLANFAMYHKRA